MTNTVQDRVKTEWEKAQKEGGQRVDRIREIVKSAASEALAELKDGSSELETQGRKTLADMIDQLKAKEAAEAEAAEAATAEQTSFGGATAPTWAGIFAELRYLANDRKVDWAQQLLSKLQDQIDRFDTDMNTGYGDRYGFVRPLVQGLRSLVALAYGKVSQSAEPATSTPVHIEVLDEAEPRGDDSFNG
ncbi:MAG: hypothetical protein WBB18_15540 [Nodosilinea sp.]